MKNIFKKAVVSGILAASLATSLCVPAFAEVSAYNGVAIRKPGERRVAEAAFVAEKCWRPLTGEGASRYPQAVEAISAHAQDTILGASLLDRVKKADIAFCPSEAGMDRPPVSYSTDARIASVTGGLDASLTQAYLRNAAAQGVLLSDKKTDILGTASTEKRIRHDLYLAASAAVQEVVVAIEEKDMGRPEAWERVRKTYGTLQDAAFDGYQSARDKGLGKTVALSEAAAISWRSLFEDREWLQVQVADVLVRTLGEIKRGELSNRPVDDADEKLEGLLKYTGRLAADVNYSAKVSAPSRDAIFKDNVELLWAMQQIDIMRYASGYGPMNYRVDAVMKEMAETKNPEYQRLMAPSAPR